MLSYTQSVTVALVVLVVSIVPRARAQSSVSLPTVSGAPGEHAQLPVTVSDLTGEGVIAYDFTITYDPAVLQLTGVTTSGTLSDGWTVSSNGATPGVFVVSAANASAVAGSGTLLLIEADYLSAGTSPLTWSAFTFNEGTPSAILTDGSVTVSGGPTNSNPVANDDTATTDEDSPVIIDVLANDSDPDGDVLSIASVTDPPHGTATNNGSTVTYTPELNFNGTDTFDYTVSDGNGGTATATVTVTVSNPPPPSSEPSVSLPTVSGAPGEHAQLPVTVSDLTGEGVIAYDFTITYDPAVLQLTGVTTSGTLSDGWTVSSNGATPGVFVVSAANASAVAGSGTLLLIEADYLSAGTSPLTWSAFTFNEGTPSAILTDGSVTVSGGPTNSNPVANDDTATTDEDSPVIIDVLANDSDPDGDVLSIASVTDPPHGTATNNGSTVTYTPELNFNGTDTFDYTVSDGNGGTATATVTVTVSNPPPPSSEPSVSLPTVSGAPGEHAQLPVTVSDLTGEGVIAYDFTITYDPAVLQLTGVTTSGTLSDGWTVSSNGATPGVFVVSAANASAVAGSGTLLLIEADYLSAGTSPLTWSAFTFNEGTPSAILTDGSVTVSGGPTNSNPVANDDTATTDEDSPVIIDVLANDSDPDGDVLSIASVTDPPHGTATNNGSTVTYTPELNFNGTDTFDYTVSDGNGGTATATVTVTVSNPPPPSSEPSVSLPTVSGAPGEHAQLPVTVSDLTGEGVIAYDFTITYDPAVLQLTGVTTSGTLSDGWTVSSNGATPGVFVVSAANASAVAGSGTLLLIEADYLSAGTSPLTWSAFTFNEGTPSAILTDGSVTVSGGPTNSNPVANDDTATTDEDSPVIIDVLANDSDPDGDVLSIASVTDPPHGTATNNGSTVTYTPELNFNGTDTFDYTVSDGNGGTATATVTVTINPVNDAPGPAVLTAPEDGASILIEGAPDATLQVSWMQAEDPDGDGLTYVWELAMSETFETVLHREEVGAVTQFELAYATVAGLLTEQGIGPNESVHVFHRVVSSDGALETPGSPFSLQLTRGTIVSKEDDGSLPERYVFSGNYPNPFRTITTFRFALPQPGHVKLEVYNLLGERVATVVEGVYPAGWHTARWDATGLVSGIYFVRMQGKDVVISQAVTLIQ
ncbi:MAG: hypothetical protein KatS3mg109_2041 [Pirellulaceae bacterium]|nr:MAG: hypothetical protein KatS3mg042_0389 [Rhodothermaceae bacterium]GIW91609.1 MAG: hypothetical protein KatS3mg109_2041 [Pirellulaceae bacterium]